MNARDESNSRLWHRLYTDKVRQWPSQWPEFFAVDSGDDVGSAAPFPVLTFEDEDRPYGWPEIDA